MGVHPRILLVEHLDAIGSSESDLKLRAQVLRDLGAEVRLVALSSGADVDLQHGTTERRQPGLERFEEERGGLAVRDAAEQWRADLVVWASATPGGGPAPLELGPALQAHWWPSGWSAERGPGPLAPLVTGLTPGDACVVDHERPRGARLSLWDGPYALVASPLRADDAEPLFESFASAADQRDEVDLVVLDHPEPVLEARARAAGIVQRVHFVGPAPREAECAWLQHARMAFVTLQRPLAAGLVMRALAAGCPLLPVGAATAPVAGWLREQGAAWTKPGRARLDRDAVAAALARPPAVEAAIARGRAHAAQASAAALAARLAPILAPKAARRPRAA